MTTHIKTNIHHVHAVHITACGRVFGSEIDSDIETTEILVTDDEGTRLTLVLFHQPGLSISTTTKQPPAAPEDTNEETPS